MREKVAGFVFFLYLGVVLVATLIRDWRNG